MEEREINQETAINGTDIDPRIYDFFTPLEVSEIERLRQEGHNLIGLGCCDFVAYGIADVFGGDPTRGMYATLKGHPICCHFFNYLTGGVILDATADQFNDGGYAVRLVFPEDQNYIRYRPAFTNKYNPQLNAELTTFPYIGMTDSDFFKRNPNLPNNWWLSI